MYLYTRRQSVLCLVYLLEYHFSTGSNDEVLYPRQCPLQLYGDVVDKQILLGRHHSTGVDLQAKLEVRAVRR